MKINIITKLFTVLLATLIISTVSTDGSDESYEIDEEVLSDKITRADRVVSLLEELDKSPEVIKVGEWDTYEVTAYTAGYESTQKTPDHPLYGITASGNEVQENHTIAMDDAVPFGTKVYIPYFGEIFTVEDRGGAINEGDIDVYMEDVEDARRFGRREKEAMIIEWGGE